MKGTWKILKQAMNKEAKQTDIDKILIDDEESLTSKKFLNGLMTTLLRLVRSLLRVLQNRPSLHKNIFQKSAKMAINLSFIR